MYAYACVCVCVCVCVWKREPLCTAGGNINWHSYYGKQYGDYLKIKNRTTIWSSNSTSGYLSEENENTNLKRYMHSYVHRNIIYNSQDMEAT